MTNDEFRAWILGYVQLTNDLPLNARQITIIKNHANLAHKMDGFLTPDNQVLLSNLKSNQRLGQYFMHWNIDN